MPRLIFILKKISNKIHFTYLSGHVILALGTDPLDAGVLAQLKGEVTLQISILNCRIIQYCTS